MIVSKQRSLNDGSDRARLLCHSKLKIAIASALLLTCNACSIDLSESTKSLDPSEAKSTLDVVKSNDEQPEQNLTQAVSNVAVPLTSSTTNAVIVSEVATRTVSRLPSANRVPVTPLTPEEEKAREAARKRGDYTFDDLKFDIEKDEPFEDSKLNDAVRSLDQKKIRIRGYMLPSSVFQTKDIKQFVLVRDNQECCFGPGAALYDCIMVEMAADKSVDFFLRPITVTGTFAIDTKSFVYPEGGHYAIFRMIATDAR